MLTNKRKALLESALNKESGKRTRDVVPAETPLTLVAEKASLAKYMVPLDDESLALQAELRILKELEANAKPLRRENCNVLEGEASEVSKVDDVDNRLAWNYPAAYKSLTEEQKQILMMNGGIALEDSMSSAKLWVPIQKFKHLKLPKSLLHFLSSRLSIVEPTSIQKAALPVVLSGRDLLGVAGTGSGKTLCYLLPLSLICLREEKALEFAVGEGPCAFVIVPNRELALQVQAIGQDLLDVLSNSTNLGSGGRCLNFEVAIGGIAGREQRRALSTSAVHAVIGTPGRLQDLIEQKVLRLDQVKFLVMDESDRLLDEGFNDPIRFICNNLPRNLQTILFSATMPPRVKQFAQSSLVKPVTIYVGKAGRANKRVRQKMEIIAPESRLKFLLMTLQETPPPVVVFCGNKAEVDEVLEHLILAGVEAAAIHGGLEQKDRSKALQDFIRGEKDVLIGTDVASKGLDLPNVQHVISYTLPIDIEDYIHRIGRTGRKGNSGLATSFVTSVFEESLLLDLRGIFLEAGQETPEFLNILAKARGLPDETIECAYCGGPGHRVMTCSRLRAYRLRQPNALLAAMS